MVMFKVALVDTTPFEGQKPGTSDLWKKVFRLSGSGSEGATIRLFIEQYETDPSQTGRDSQEALASLVEVSLKLSKMQEFTGRSAPPSVIT